MAQSDRTPDDFDKPWKWVVERFLKPFLQLCFPAVHDLVDWQHPAEFLDTELQQLGPEHEQGGRSVDRLVKVRLLDGREEWLFIHIEIQAQPESQFPQRMWIYYYRIWDKYAQRVVSLAVLADEDANWRPHAYQTETAGCRLLFEFPTFKVLDFQDAQAVFERTRNPFALVIAAHQLALATKRNPLQRYEGRFRLLRYLLSRGLDSGELRALLKVTAMLTRLPKNLELQFKAEMATIPQMSIDELKTPLEEYLIEEGWQESVLQALELRFGALPEDVRARVKQLTGEAELRRVHRLAITEPSLGQFLAKL